MGNELIEVGRGSDRALSSTTLAVDGFCEATPEFSAAIRALARGGEPRLSTSLVIEAEAIVRKGDGDLSPASHKAIGVWVSALARARLRSTPDSEAGVAHAAHALIETCAMLPRVVWCDETRIAYQQSSPFWPAPADLYAFLSAYAGTVSAKHRAAKRILAMRQAAAEVAQADRASQLAREAPGYAEALSTMRAQAATLAASMTTPSPPVARASVLNPAQLRAAYAADKSTTPSALAARLRCADLTETQTGDKHGQ